MPYPSLNGDGVRTQDLHGVNRVDTVGEGDRVAVGLAGDHLDIKISIAMEEDGENKYICLIKILIYDKCVSF